MSTRPQSSFMGKVAAVLALIEIRNLATAASIFSILLGPGHLGAISLPECPPVCRSGEQTFAEVTFFGAATHDIFQLTPPFVLDQSLADSAGSGRGLVNLSTGVLRAQVEAAVDSPQFTVITTGGDLFTLGGLAPGTPVTVGATIIANGTGLIPVPGRSGSTMVQIGGGGGPFLDFERRVFQAGTNAPLNSVFPIALEADIAFPATIGTPFPLVYFLRLDSNGATQFDFLSTATIGFTLPGGVTISSVGGFAPGNTAPVPEPTSLLLVGSGLASLAAWRISRRSRSSAI